MTLVCGIDLPDSKSQPFSGPLTDRGEFNKCVVKALGKQSDLLKVEDVRIGRDLTIAVALSGAKRELRPSVAAIKAMCNHVGAPFSFISSLPSDLAATVLNRLLLSRIDSHLVCTIKDDLLANLRPTVDACDSQLALADAISAVASYISKNWPKQMYMVDNEYALIYGHTEPSNDKNKNSPLVLARFSLSGLSSLRSYEGVILSGLDRRPVAIFKQASMKTGSLELVEDFMSLHFSPKRTGHDLYIDKITDWHKASPSKNVKELIKSSIGVSVGNNYANVGELILSLQNRDKNCKSYLLRQILHGSIIDSAMSLFKDIAK